MVRLWNEFETSRPLVTKPFCDQSHKNTDFKPLRFYIQDPVKSVNLCGCKLSKQAPFCDGETCVSLKNASRPEIKLD
jgi:CDGSH-type Zn-finger protein